MNTRIFEAFHCLQRVSANIPQVVALKVEVAFLLGLHRRDDSTVRIEASDCKSILLTVRLSLSAQSCRPVL